MNKNQIQISLKNLIPLLYLTLFVLILVAILFLICFIPMIYDWLYGDEILSNHVQEIIGNKTEDAEIASALMQWSHDNIVYPDVKNKTFILGVLFFKINGENRFFWRDAPASWTIIKKIGMCGEDANYFVGVMEYLGYKSRKVTPDGKNRWDHAWAEYYTHGGTKIILDPSSNQIIKDTHGWVQNKTFTKIIATDLEGNKEDVTKDYI